MYQISSKSNNFQRNWAGEETRWSKQKAQTSRDAQPIRLPIIKSWVKGNVGSWDFTRSLVNYLHHVCAKIHPNRRNFRVKRRASKRFKTKGSNFTRCSTYSASNGKISVQKELKTLKLCIYNYFHFVCAKNHPNPTFLRVKGLARKKRSTEKAQISRDTRPFLFPKTEYRVLEALHVVSQLLPLYVCQVSSKSNNFQGERANEEKSGQTKKHKFHELLLCFQWQNLGSKGA